MKSVAGGTVPGMYIGLGIVLLVLGLILARRTELVLHDVPVVTVAPADS